MVQGRFDEALTEYIESVLRPGDVFIDVGANIGYFSLIALMKVGPRGRIHAFEIDPRALKCIELTNTYNKLHNLCIHPYAVGSRVGSVNLMMESELGHTFIEPSCERTGFHMTSLDTSLDHLSKEGVRLIKIDVEGAELLVLSGAVGLLSESRPTIVCEVSGPNLLRFGHNEDQLFEFVRSCNYSITQLQGTCDPNYIFSPLQSR